MSREAVTKIIAKAIADEKFRKQLIADPKQALVGYDLTKEEAEGLSKVNAEAFNALASQVEERVSKTAFRVAPDIRTLMCGRDAMNLENLNLIPDSPDAPAIKYFMCCNLPEGG